MSQALLTKLKKKLPYRYAVTISRKSSQLSVRQVKAVFNGETKDEKKILEVVQLANEIIKEKVQKKKNISKKIKSIISKK